MQKPATNEWLKQHTVVVASFLKVRVRAYLPSLCGAWELKSRCRLGWAVIWKMPSGCCGCGTHSRRLCPPSQHWIHVLLLPVSHISNGRYLLLKGSPVCTHSLRGAVISLLQVWVCACVSNMLCEDGPALRNECIRLSRGSSTYSGV